MKVTFRFKSYDKKLWLTPSFGVVRGWTIPERPHVVFGTGIDPCLLSVEAEAMEVVRWSHKPRLPSSTRAPRPDAPRPLSPIEGWGIVQPDGTITEVSREEARAHLTARRARA